MSRFARLARTSAPALAAAAMLTGGFAAASTASSAGSESGDVVTGPKFSFTMVRSTGAVNANCIRGAGADVTIEQLGDVEKMTVRAHGLPAATEFDLFVLQQPDAPFGVSWYQSDMRSDQSGNATVVVRGRFNEETFSVAPGTLDAPVVHDADAASNPPYGPIHMYHVGLWFNSPADAAAAGCPNTVTPFNGEHDAGIQALSTRQFPDLAGPLSHVG